MSATVNRRRPRRAPILIPLSERRRIRRLVEQAYALRDEGIAQAEAADRDGWDRATIDQAISAFANTGCAFSANELREVLPEVRPALVGARFLAAASRGELVEVGRVASTLANTHGHRIALWLAAGEAGRR